VAQSERNRFIWAEGVQESGGNYGAVNAGSGALGRWQVMPGNLPGWEAQCGMPYAGGEYFLTHPLYQNRLVTCILGRYYDRYGARGAASIWYSGQPNWQATYGNPPVYQYVNDVIAIMNSGRPGTYTGGGSSGSGGSIPTGPIPTRADDWSAHIHRSGEQAKGAGDNMKIHARYLESFL